MAGPEGFREGGAMKKIFVLVVALSLMGAILNFSSQTAMESANLSGEISSRIVLLMDLSGDQTLSNSEVNLIVRKLAHFSEYLLLGVLLSVGLTNILTKAWLAVPLAFICGVAFAFGDEWIQGAMPGRGQSVFDVMVDVAGISVGLLAFCIILIGLHRKARSSGH